jgi:hypothetical protein
MISFFQKKKRFLLQLLVQPKFYLNLKKMGINKNINESVTFISKDEATVEMNKRAHR